MQQHAAAVNAASAPTKNAIKGESEAFLRYLVDSVSFAEEDLLWVHVLRSLLSSVLFLHRFPAHFYAFVHRHGPEILLKKSSLTICLVEDR